MNNKKTVETEIVIKTLLKRRKNEMSRKIK